MTSHPNRSKAPMHCAYCGKPATKLTTTVYVRSPQDVQPLSTSWSRYAVTETPLKSKADCERHTNKRVVSISYHGGTDNRHIGSFTEWDGESWELKYHPFCTLACAHAFAKAAFEAGFRMVRGKAA